MTIESLQPFRRHAPEDLVFESEGDARNSGNSGTIGHVGNGSELLELGTWPDDAHLTLEHVYELGKFIKLQPAQEFSQRRDAGVSFGSEARALVFADYHGAKFQHL